MRFFIKKPLGAMALAVGLVGGASHGLAQVDPAPNALESEIYVAEQTPPSVNTGFAMSFVGEGVYFPSKKGDASRTKGQFAPGAGFNLGYRGQSFDLMAGVTYFFNNFYGSNDLLVQATAHYFFNVSMGSSSNFSVGLGGGVAHNFLGGYIDRISSAYKKVTKNADGTTKEVKRDSRFFALVDVPMRFSFGLLGVGIVPKLYIPIDKSADIGYGGAVDLTLVF